MTYNNLQTSGKPVAIKDEGVLLTSAVSSIDFRGSGVTGSVSFSDVTETIPGGSIVTQVTGEVPSGSIDGANQTFTIAHTPIDAFQVYLGGARQQDGGDYVLIGTTLTMNIAPQTGSILIVDYVY